VIDEVDGIAFDSNFDSGNLYRAYKMDEPAHFDLIMQNDVNSSGYTNWFYFLMEIAEDAPETISLNCVNFV
jgi:hypothetical protein